MSALRICSRSSLLSLGVWAALAAPGPGAAQTPPLQAGTGVRYESYSFGSPEVAGASTVALLTLPFAARLQPVRGLSLDVRGALARGTVSAWGYSFLLSGLTDTQLRATGTVESGRTALALAAVGELPSGQASLTLEEAIVAGTIASDLLPFAVSNWGSGGGGGLDISVVRALQQVNLGLTASYRVAREFEPFAGLQMGYRPGSELRIGAAIDGTLADDRTLALQLAYSRFGEDQLEGRGWLRTGQRVLALGSYATPLGSGSLSAFGGVLYRSGGALGESLVAWNIWDILGRLAPPSETLLLAGASARLPWGERLLLPSLDVRVLRRGDGTGQGVLMGLGGSAELPLGEAGVHLVPGARLRLGRLLAGEGASSAIRGLELGIGLEFGGAR